MKLLNSKIINRYFFYLNENKNKNKNKQSHFLSRANPVVEKTLNSLLFSFEKRILQ